MSNQSSLEPMLFRSRSTDQNYPSSQKSIMHEKTKKKHSCPAQIECGKFEKSYTLIKKEKSIFNSFWSDFSMFLGWVTKCIHTHHFK